MRRSLIALSVALVFFGAAQAQAAILMFNDAITGATSYNFDADGDGIIDVVLSTTDPLGFNTAGPGPNMSYINEPGLEGTTLLSPDLRVDLLSGASLSLDFGFAVDTMQGGVVGNDGVMFEVFDADGNLLASVYQVADYTLPDGVNSSSFPEARVHAAFSGLAAYATFDFDNQDPIGGNRYIIDNVEGNFGNSEPKPLVPEPATIIIWSLLGGLGLIFAWRRRKSA